MARFSYGRQTGNRRSSRKIKIASSPKASKQKFQRLRLLFSCQASRQIMLRNICLLTSVPKKEIRFDFSPISPLLL